jgi:hypothetical protein
MEPGIRQNARTRNAAAGGRARSSVGEIRRRLPLIRHLSRFSTRQQFEGWSVRQITDFLARGFDLIRKFAADQRAAWTLARIAGHASIAISSCYVHPSQDAVSNAMSRLNGHNIRHSGVEAKNSKAEKTSEVLRLKKKGGAPGEIRTPDLLLRRQSLYPAELRARSFDDTTGAPSTGSGL